MQQITFLFYCSHAKHRFSPLPKKESVFAVPGFIRVFLAGKITSQSLPESAWKRLLSGERLATDTQDISTAVSPGWADSLQKA